MPGKLLSGLGLGELPSNLSFDPVPFFFPSTCLLGERLDITNPSVQALPGKCIGLDLSHVEPASLFGSKMELELPGQFKSLLRRKGTIE